MRISDWSSDVCSSDLGEPRVVADQRRNTDDAPVAARLEMRQRGAAEPHEAVEIGPENAVELLVAQRLERREGKDRDVVADDVEPADCVDRILTRRIPRPARPQVKTHQSPPTPPT